MIAQDQPQPELEPAFEISKRFAFEAAHHLTGVGVDHPCAATHGHSYRVDLVLRGPLDGRGFVRDYRDLDVFKVFLAERFDHRDLNETLANPTAENLAHYMYQWAAARWPELVAVRVSETAKTWADYRPERRTGFGPGEPDLMRAVEELARWSRAPGPKPEPVPEASGTGRTVEYEPVSASEVVELVEAVEAAYESLGVTEPSAPEAQEDRAAWVERLGRLRSRGFDLSRTMLDRLERFAARPHTGAEMYQLTEQATRAVSWLGMALNTRPEELKGHLDSGFDPDSQFDLVVEACRGFEDQEARDGKTSGVVVSGGSVRVMESKPEDVRSGVGAVLHVRDASGAVWGAKVERSESQSRPSLVFLTDLGARVVTEEADRFAGPKVGSLVRVKEARCDGFEPRVVAGMVESDGVVLLDASARLVRRDGAGPVASPEPAPGASVASAPPPGAVPVWRTGVRSGGWTEFPSLGGSGPDGYVTAVGGEAGSGPARPRVVCLCGSTRFRAEYARAFSEEEHAGRVCLTVPCYKSDPCCKTREGQDRLDALHLRKIDMADEVLVVSPRGYVGESTRREIEYARARGKPVRYDTRDGERPDPPAPEAEAASLVTRGNGLRRPEACEGYAVTLCQDGSEPLNVLEAMHPIHHVGLDGRACFTPSNDCGFARRWRHPTQAELGRYLAARSERDRREAESDGYDPPRYQVTEALWVGRRGTVASDRGAVRPAGPREPAEVVAREPLAAGQTCWRGRDGGLWSNPSDARSAPGVAPGPSQDDLDVLDRLNRESLVSRDGAHAATDAGADGDE